MTCGHSAQYIRAGVEWLSDTLHIKVHDSCRAIQRCTHSMLRVVRLWV